MVGQGTVNPPPRGILSSILKASIVHHQKFPHFSIISSRTFFMRCVLKIENYKVESTSTTGRIRSAYKTKINFQNFQLEKERPLKDGEFPANIRYDFLYPENFLFYNSEQQLRNFVRRIYHNDMFSITKIRKNGGEISNRRNSRLADLFAAGRITLEQLRAKQHCYNRCEFVETFGKENKNV